MARGVKAKGAKSGRGARVLTTSLNIGSIGRSSTTTGHVGKNGGASKYGGTSTRKAR